MVQPIISYPSRPMAGISLGYNIGGLTSNAYVDAAAAGGATFIRTQFGWEAVEDYTTGVMSLTAGQQSFLSYCGAKSVQPVIVAAYGPPRIQIGTLTTTADTPINSPAGTAIPVAARGFTIDPPMCFAGDVNGGSSQYTNKASYYGSLISAVTANSITLASATRVDIPAGATIAINRLRYPSPTTDGDSANQSYVNYATYLANQMAAARAKGLVSLWNEYVWPHDSWGFTQGYYDSPPGGVTLTVGMKAILALAQATPLPPNVAFANGTSDKSGFKGLIPQGITIPGSITYDGMHPYGSNPEAAAWDYLAWGFNNNRALPATLAAGDSWWEVVNDPIDHGGNLRNLAFLNDLTPNAPLLMASECGIQDSNDVNHAKYISRRVASLWGVNAVPVIYALDDGSSFSTAPNLVPRPAYYALQRMTQMINRMAPGNDPMLSPIVMAYDSTTWPLMVTTVHGSRGHATMFLWQRTYQTSNVYADWTAITPPAAKMVQLYVPFTQPMECVNVRTGAAVPVQRSGYMLSVSVTDDVTALRLQPQRSIASRVT